MPTKKTDVLGYDGNRAIVLAYSEEEIENTEIIKKIAQAFKSFLEEKNVRFQYFVEGCFLGTVHVFLFESIKEANQYFGAYKSISIRLSTENTFPHVLSLIIANTFKLHP